MARSRGRDARGLRQCVGGCIGILAFVFRDNERPRRIQPRSDYDRRNADILAQSWSDGRLIISLIAEGEKPDDILSNIAVTTT